MAAARRLLARLPALPALLLLSALGPALGAVRKEEVAQLKCEVCGYAMAEAHALAAEKEAKNELHRKSEEAISDFVENMCRIGMREGRWIRRLDVRNKDSGGTQLHVVNMTEYGLCTGECNLARAACAAALKGVEEDFAALLSESAPLEALRKKVCKKACAKTPPALKTPRVDEPFVEGEGAGILEMLENREKLRQETGQIIEVQRRDEVDAMTDGDKEAMAAQDAFAEEMREARHRSGRNWKGEDL